MKSSVRYWVPLLLAAVMLLAGCSKKENAAPEEDSQPVDRSLVIGYAEEGVTVVEDPQEMAKAIQQAIQNAENSAIALEYKNEAFSHDGVNFDCYIANSLENKFDMFIQIFSDGTFQDELFLSQLLRPGQAFEKLTLNHELPEGTTRVYVALTQVETVNGEQAVHAQTFVTMDFSVSAQ